MTDSHSPAAAGRRRSSIHAASAALFGQAGSPLLAEFDSEANHRVIRGGETLFRQGDPGDALYIVSHGSLEVLAEEETGLRMLDVIGRGGIAGEMALLVDEPRSATVRAIRDSEVVRIDKSAFEALLTSRPAVAVELARSLVRRLRLASTSRRHRTSRRTRTIALLPARESDIGSVAELAEALAVGLSRERGVGPPLPRSGMTAKVATADRVERALGPGTSMLGPGDAGETRLVEWLSALEDSHAFVLFRGEGLDSPWTARCLRQADLVLVVADAGGTSQAHAGRAVVERALASVPWAGSARRELVLLHDAGVERPSGTAEWLGAAGVSTHHHVRPARDEDIRRLARAIAGRSLGVALSGGGARGFAHIGVLKAIREAGLPIDVVGGTSMGSIVAAQWAAGYDTAAMIELCRRHYATDPGPSDRTLPVVSFSSARRTVRRLKAMFGDVCIEDLWTRYFAVTASLTHARTRIHDSGPLWLWTRVSCAIPGLTPPVAYDGELLADGGLLDNLPVGAARERCSGKVVASDVSVPVDLRPSHGPGMRPILSGWPLLWERVNPLGSAPPSFPSIIEILERAALLGGVRDSEAAGREADLYLRPPVDDFGMTSFAAIDRLVEIGYSHAVERIEEWQILVRAGMSDEEDIQV